MYLTGRWISKGMAGALAFGFNSLLYAEDQQRIYRSAAFLAHGDAGISEADNQEAIFYNPAGVATGKGIFKKVVLASPHVELSSDARDLYREIGQEGDDRIEALRKRVGTPEHGGVYNFTGIIFRRVALGVVNSATLDALVYKNPNAGGLESIKASFVQNNGITFTLAEEFFDDQFFAGVTSKFIQRGQAAADVNVTDADKVKSMQASDLYGVGFGSGVDVGFLLRGKSRVRPACGFTVMNVGGTHFSAVDEKATALTDLEQTVNFGCSVTPGTKLSQLKLMADYWDIAGAVEKSPFKRTHIGASLSILDTVGFSAGLSGGGPSAGAFVDVRVLRVDAGFYTEEMDDRVGVRPDRRLFVRLLVGF